MNILQTSIAGLMEVEINTSIDHRGAFARLYCQQELREIVGSRQILQVNYSRTRNVGAVRGLHFQRDPHMEMKLVRCIKGRVWDVAVDLRAGSPTFLKWHAVEISKTNMRMVVIPEGCAHGFQVLEEDSELLYLHTEYYTPTVEGGIQPTDPTLAIAWPLPVQDLSDRDTAHPFVDSNFTGLNV